AGGNDGFVARYTGAGALEWARALGGASGDSAQAVAVAADGSLVVGGTFSGSASFGGATLTSGGGTDGFLVGLSATGAHRWSSRLGGPSTDNVAALAMGAGGAVVATGSFYSTASFGGAAQGSAGFSDVFVASYGAATGAHAWSRRHGGTGEDEARALAIDIAGNIYLAGVFEGTAGFGGTSLSSAGGRDGVLASYTPDGLHRWSGRYGGDDYDELAGVAFAAPDRLYAIGSTSSGVFYPPGAVLSPLGNSDVILTAYDLEGAHVWSTRMGGSLQDYGKGIAAHGDRAILVGAFEGSAAFAGLPLMAAGGEYDAEVFVASLRGR
nr:hypothetical protein [Myxococcota bacterium]